MNNVPSSASRRGSKCLALQRSAFGACILALALPSAARAQETTGEKIEKTRATLEKWVEARSTISKEQLDWKLKGEVFQERIGILEREIAAVRGRIAEATSSVAEAEKKHAELEAQSDERKRSSGTLAEMVAKLEEGTRRLVQRLPPLAAERVKLFSQRLPPAGAETKLPLSERYQSVVAILNDLNKLNREITVVPEVRELGDGRTAEVPTVYVGLSQGYYATANGAIAGTGTATATEWTWRPASDHAGEISRMIAILKNEQVADFVRLPIRIEDAPARR